MLFLSLVDQCVSARSTLLKKMHDNCSCSWRKHVKEAQCHASQMLTPRPTHVYIAIRYTYVIYMPRLYTGLPHTRLIIRILLTTFYILQIRYASQSLTRFPLFQVKIFGKTRALKNEWKKNKQSILYWGCRYNQLMMACIRYLKMTLFHFRNKAQVVKLWFKLKIARKKKSE